MFSLNLFFSKILIISLQNLQRWCTTWWCIWWSNRSSRHSWQFRGMPGYLCPVCNWIPFLISSLYKGSNLSLEQGIVNEWHLVLNFLWRSTWWFLHWGFDGTASHTVQGHFMNHPCMLQLYMMAILESQAGPHSLTPCCTSSVLNVRTCFGSSGLCWLFIDQTLQGWSLLCTKVV